MMRGGVHNPAATLAAVRRIAAADQAAALATACDAPTLLVVETSHVAARHRAASPAHIVVLILDDLLSGTAAVPQGEWVLVFATEPLVEYTERLVVRALGRAPGVRVARMETHVWAAEGEVQQGWAA
jgi:hypothetical protein